MNDSNENTETNSGDNVDDEVQVFHRINRLKLKAGADSLHDGPGFIDPKAVNSAQSVIMKKEAIYMEETEKVLIDLEKFWDEAKKMGDGPAGKEAIENLFNVANQVKDLAATYGYVLMQHFGVSLRDFSQRIDITNKAHHIIVQAHIDVMWVVYHEKIKDQGGEKAAELKAIVAKAIEKFS